MSFIQYICSSTGFFHSINHRPSFNINLHKPFFMTIIVFIVELCNNLIFSKSMDNKAADNFFAITVLYYLVITKILRHSYCLN